MRRSVLSWLGPIGARITSRVLVVFAVSTAFLMLTSQDAWAKYKFCATYTPSYTDTTSGEDFLKTGPHTVAYHRLLLYRNDVLLGDKFAGPDGCYPDTQTAAGSYTLRLVTNVKYVSAEVRVYSSSGPQLPTIAYGWSNLPADTSASIVTKSYTANGTVYDPLFRVSLAAAWALSNMSVGNTVYNIYAEATASSGGSGCVACVTGWNMYLGQDGTGAWTNTSKSTILHEFGHLIANSSFGGFITPGTTPASTYCASVTNGAGFDACRCDQVDPTGSSPYCGGEDWDRLHCLNSREYVHAAFNEGWGHYLATRVLNDSTQSGAVFPYYKDSLSSNLSELQAPVAHQARPSTAHRWMETKCSDTMTDRGTEMDWLSFFYYVGTQTANAYSLQNYWALMYSSSVCNGPCTSAHEVDWDDIVAGVNNTAGFSGAKKLHFINSGDSYGVNH